MSDPWLTIIGLGEDGLSGLSDASREALLRAEIIFGGPRHLALIEAGSRGRDWPVPFSIDPVLAEKGRQVVVLASGDPFWFGAGGSLSRVLSPLEWICHPAPSTFGQVAARLGWRLEETHCFGLHAAPFERILPMLSAGQRLICLMRDGTAVGKLADWLTVRGFGATDMTVLEAVGGPSERIRARSAQGYDLTDVADPVAISLTVAGGKGMPRAAGLPDEMFASDGVMTKRPIRALTLSALAPRPGEVLWDLGAGSGSVSVEWCLAAPGTTAHAVELRGDRAANIRANAAAFGLLQRLIVHECGWAGGLSALPPPDAVFVGGGADMAGLETIFRLLGPGARLVVNAVTIETEMLLAKAQNLRGGNLFRYDVAQALPLGQMSGWSPARPVVQWSVIV